MKTPELTRVQKFNNIQSWMKEVDLKFLVVELERRDHYHRDKNPDEPDRCVVYIVGKEEPVPVGSQALWKNVLDLNKLAAVSIVVDGDPIVGAIDVLYEKVCQRQSSYRRIDYRSAHPINPTRYWFLGMLEFSGFTIFEIVDPKTAEKFAVLVDFAKVDFHTIVHTASFAKLADDPSYIYITRYRDDPFDAIQGKFARAGMKATLNFFMVN